MSQLDDGTANRRRNYKLEAKQRKHASLVVELLDDLPNGFKFQPATAAELEVTQDFSENNYSVEGALTKDRVRAGDFIIDIDEISMKGLVRMRKLLPRDEYQSIKNRKSSRLIRSKKKLQNQQMDSQFKQLQAENLKLKEELELAQRELLSLKTVNGKPADPLPIESILGEDSWADSSIESYTATEQDDEEEKVEMAVDSSESTVRDIPQHKSELLSMVNSNLLSPETIQVPLKPRILTLQMNFLEKPFDADEILLSPLLGNKQSQTNNNCFNMDSFVKTDFSS